MEQINSRFKITERPFNAPGKCLICGSVDRPVVDFGLEGEFSTLENTELGETKFQRFTDFVGVAYWCRDCVREAALVFDIASKEDYLKLALKCEQLEVDLKEAYARVTAKLIDFAGSLTPPPSFDLLDVDHLIEGAKLSKG